MSPRTTEVERDSFRIRTRQICCFAPIDCLRRNLTVPHGVDEGRVVDLCGPPHSGVHDLRPTPCKPPESKLDGGEGKESAQSFGKVLEILDETPVASEPGESALDFCVRLSAPDGDRDAAALRYV